MLKCIVVTAADVHNDKILTPLFGITHNDPICVVTEADVHNDKILTPLFGIAIMIPFV